LQIALIVVIAVRTIVGDGRGDKKRQAAAQHNALLHFSLPIFGWKN
jgi:hypothetical protein